MKKFLRSINQNSQKHITVVNGDDTATYSSLCDMPSNDRMEYVINAMDFCECDNLTPEQIAMVRASVKDMMIRQALSHQGR